MRVETVPVHGDNYAYLVLCEQSGQAAAVDPADAGAVLNRARELGVAIAAIWCTHHHPDHTGGNQELLRLLGPLPVVAHLADAGRIPGYTDGVEHDGRLTLGQLEARVIHTPGHTTGSICYLVQDALLTGDTLFACGCGRLFEGEPATMFHSLHQRLKLLPPATRVYCGHEYTEKNLDFAWSVEPESAELRQRMEQVRALRSQGRPSVPFTLEQELATNPFLRCDSPEIVRTLTEQHGLEGDAELEVFTRLRELRNHF